MALRPASNHPILSNCDFYLNHMVSKSIHVDRSNSVPLRTQKNLRHYVARTRDRLFYLIGEDSGEARMRVQIICIHAHIWVGDRGRCDSMAD